MTDRHDGAQPLHAPCLGTRSRLGSSLAIAVVSLLAVAEAEARPLSHTSRVTSARYALDGWEIGIDRDRFSGDVHCRLRARGQRVEYIAGALTFAFGRRVDTTQGWYRLDGAAPQRVRDAFPELARLGIVIQSRSLASPTGGLVVLPVAWLAGVDRIDIQPVPGRRARSFHLRGFVRLHDAAQSLGCDPETRFVQ